MYFNIEFVKSLPNDPFAALVSVCDKYLSIYEDLDKGSREEHDLVVETCAFLRRFGETIGVRTSVPPHVYANKDSVENAHASIMQVRADGIRMSTQSQLDRYENLLTTKFGTEFQYEFSEGDLGRIQKLVNELRDLITASDELEENYKHRLLNRLEKFQSEIHKKVRDVDRFWGFLIEASVIMHIMGENAKPMVDRLKELKDIIWPTQARAFDLPSNVPFRLLGESEEENKSGSKS